MYMKRIDPNLREVMGQSDAESIQNAVDLAHRTGVNSVRIPRINERTGEAIWIVDRAVILPSNMEIVLENCHIRQADECMDNIFRNFADTEKEGHRLEERMENIVIRGEGNAVLDGGNHNGLTEKTSKTLPGSPPASRNCMILMYNIRDFAIEKIRIQDQRYWAINLIHAERGRLSDLHIEGQCHCPNQDGIDLRIGCSNIIIERITGQAGDDMIALSAIGNNSNPRNINRLYGVEGHNEDIHDIIIRDVIAVSVECAVIALRNCDGRRLYNITIENVHCTDNYAEEAGKLFPEYPSYQIKKFDIVRLRRSNAPYALLRIGQPGYYKDRDSILGEVSGIHATNLHMHTGCMILANVALENCYFGNLYAENDVDYVFTTKEARESRIYGADLKNVVIENVFYRNEDNEFATAFDFDINEKPCRVENVFVRNAFLGNCKKPFHVACDGQIRYSGVIGAFAEQESGTISKA